MNKSEKVTLLSIIIVVGFVFAVIYHYILGGYMGLGFPDKSFLFYSPTVGEDFIGMLYVIRDLNPYDHMDSWINYFPLAYLTIYPLTFIKNVMASYLMCLFLFLSFFWGMNFKCLSCLNLTKIENFRNIFIFTFMSYPFLMVADRGNFDMFLFILFAAFIYSFKSEKYLLAAILIAIENACKPFSILFLFLFLFKKKYKEFFVSLILTAFLVLGGFLVTKGHFFDQINTFLLNLIDFKKHYILSNYDNNYGMFGSSSLFMALKLLLTRTTHTPIIQPALLAEAYKYLNLFISVVILFFTFKEKIFWKQISLLTLQMLLLPYLTNDYKFIFLFAPIWLFLNSETKSKYDLIYTIFFGLLLIPKSMLIIMPVSGIEYYYSLSLIINPIIMISFLGLMIFEQIKNKKQEIQN